MSTAILEVLLLFRENVWKAVFTDFETKEGCLRSYRL